MRNKLLFRTGEFCFFVVSYRLSQISEQQHINIHTCYVPVLVSYQKKLPFRLKRRQELLKNKNKKDSKSNKDPECVSRIENFIFLYSFFLALYFCECGVCEYIWAEKNYYEEGEYLTVKWE